MTAAHRKRPAHSAFGQLRLLLRANRRGRGLGIYSVCSANRFVLEAAMLQAARDNSLLLVESTSNQVNQFGGYTGKTPADFAQYARDIARQMGFPAARIVLGGDHLGPQVWRSVPAAIAMEKACEMVEAYVRAGFTKIHLDTSMPCADDYADPRRPLPDEVVSFRAAQLCQAAEDAHRSLSRNAPAPHYVIGTEVPAPGGEHLGSHHLQVTRTKDLANTLALAEKAFFERGLKSAWQRVIAVVVQPGVEFGDSSICPYDPGEARPLSRFLPAHWSGVYEAHSTDYQSRESLRRMVKDHFAILKVGPALTFAFREAAFALQEIEREWLSGKNGITFSCLRETLENVMLENPVHWRNYYQGNENALRFARKYSFSDRARYYWPHPLVTAALQHLLHNLAAHPPPVSLISQYFPRQVAAVRNGKLSSHPADLIRQHILEVLDDYAFACGCSRDQTIKEATRPC
jgi:D-tagatose-1,6-bisphosphate aldolase subunit GatZ/KbaZ